MTIKYYLNIDKNTVVADELLRGNNSIGKWTLQELEKSGVNVNGCDSK